MLGRPYSFVNPPDAPVHEFYFIVLPEGPLTPRLAALNVGDEVWLAPRANGFFCIGETCSLPVTEPDTLAGTVSAARPRPPSG
jgi:ferredoxin-NADP reductase